MTTRTFHKYVFRYEVLSEELLDTDLNIIDLHNLTYDGPCSGRMLGADTEHIVLNGKEAAAALIEQASDPEFFSITPDGEEIDEEDPEATFPPSWTRDPVLEKMPPKKRRLGQK